MRLTLLPFVTALALLTPACHHGDRTRPRADDPFVEAVAQRSQFDLGCPGTQTQIVEIGGASYGVIGCGRRASYTCICMYHVWTTCTQPVCQLNGPPMQDPNAVVAPAPAPPPPAPLPPHP